MTPLQKSIDDRSLLLMSPDGNLNLLSFAALQDGDYNFVVQRHELADLDTGRDLMRVKTTPLKSGPPLVIGAPEYGLPRPGTVRSQYWKGHPPR